VENYDIHESARQIRQSKRDYARDFPVVKGLLLMTGVLVVVTILILLNTRATRIQAGLFAVPSSINSQPPSQSSSSHFLCG